jgi:hypothetical protein
VLAVRVEAVEVYFKREHLLEGREGTQLGHLKMNLAIDYLNSAIEVSKPQISRSTLGGRNWLPMLRIVRCSAALQPLKAAQEANLREEPCLLLAMKSSAEKCKPCAERVLGHCHGVEAQSFRKMHQTLRIIARI